MKNIVCGLLLLISTTIHAQQVSDILKKTYPTEIAPGIIVALRKDSVNQFFKKGFANLNEGRYIHEDTQFRLASVSKQFTSMAIYQLIRKGLLDFETPVREILTELPASTANVQILHLLQHSSGIMDYESYISNNQLDQVSDKDVLSILAQQDSVYFEAGSTFRYSNSGYCLLALIVERISQQSFSSFCKEQLFDKSDLEHAVVYKPTDTIHERAYGYHPDNTTFIFADQSLTSATQGDGGVYMSISAYSSWADAHQILFDAQYLADLKNQKILVKDNIYYSLGWFLGYDEANNLYLFHSGESTGFHNIVLFNHTQNNALVAFSNRDDHEIGELFKKIGESNSFSFTTIGLHNLFQWLSNVYANRISE